MSSIYTFNIGQALISNNAVFECLCKFDNDSPIVDDFIICSFHCKKPSTIEYIGCGGNVNKNNQKIK